MAKNLSEQFEDRLTHGPILCDGAMGTELVQRGAVGYDRPLEELNLSNPELVKSIHLDYIGAGAEIIETNTFGANRFRLAAYGLEERVREINEAAVRIAQEARGLTGQRTWIAGSVGPLGRLLAPPGPITAKEARRVFREQITALAESGADILSLETIGDLREMHEAVLAARDVCDLPVMANMTFTEEGRTAAGDSPADIVLSLERLGVTVVGSNCSVGSEGMLRVVQEMASVTRLPLSARPNAGFPTYQGGRLIYRSSPEYVAQYARQMVEAGAAIVGGCCGTTPEHIAAIRDALHAVAPPKARSGAPPAARPRQAARPAPPALEPTAFARKLGEKFVVTVEVDPPRGFDVSPTLDALADLKASGRVDAFNVADSPRAQGRMSALAMSTLIQSRLGTETILHMTLRHRNLVALHSDLLGAHALGVRNLFVIMGDPPSTGDYPGATAISDITSSGMIKLIKAFNSGADLEGKPIAQPTSYFVGCAFNPNAADLDREIRVLERKLKAGAEFILTQPVYTAEVVDRALQRVGGSPVPVLLGVLPLRSHRHAEFLHNEVPGMSIPLEVRERLRQAGDGAAEAGIQLCQDLLKEVGGQVSGIYVVPPFGRHDIVQRLLESLGDAVPDRRDG